MVGGPTVPGTTVHQGVGGGGEKAFHFVCWKLYLQLLTQIHSLSNSSLGLLRT